MTSTAMPLASQNRRNNFNFLRLLFATLVILSHSSELIDGNRSRELLTEVFHTLSFGEFAVDGFFLLSGYLIVQSWESRPRIWPFLKKRVLRIYPGFIVASLICAFVVGPLAAEPAEYFSRFQWIRFIKDLFLLHVPAVPPVFKGTSYPLVNGAMWTISLEFKCYLLVLLLGLVGAVKARGVWLALALTVFGVFVVSKMGLHFDFLRWHLSLNNPLIRLSAFFFAGGCFYLYRDELSLHARLSPTLAWLCVGLLLTLLFSPLLAEPALALLGGFLLLHFAFMRIPALVRFQTAPDISYGVYLYGWPVQMLLIWYLPDITPLGVFVFALASCALLGLVSWYGVEKPFLKLKEFHFRRTPYVEQRA